MTFRPEDFEIHSGPRKSGAFLLTAAHRAPHVVLAAPRSRFPQIPSKGLDALGFTQRKLNNNFNSWMDELSDQDKAEGSLWYPTGNDFGHYKAQEHDVHPDKMFGAMSKLSPQRAWYDNLADADNVAANFKNNPGGVLRPGGIGGGDNLKQALRVMGAEDHPDAIEAAFLGGKKIHQLPKTYDFKTNLADPERGGAYNHAAQPGTVDSWMGRSMLWSKKRWDEAQAGGKPLTWPGQGTGEGLDKGLPVKKKNPQTGQWEVVGMKPANARDVAARVTSLAGGYGRMRQAMQQGAARHDMPFTHGAQAAVWKAISGNKNPNDPEFDHSKMGPSGNLWNQMWNQRASGLHVPVQDLDRRIGRLAAHGSAFDPDGPEDANPMEGWGGPEDISAILRHVMAAPDWDHFEDRPKLIPLSANDPTDGPLERHERQRMGPHPGPIEASRWYLPEHRPVERLSWYIDAAGDGLDESTADLMDPKKKRAPGTTSQSPGNGPSASGGAGDILPGMNDDKASSGSTPSVPTWRIPGDAALWGGGGSGGSSGGSGTGMPSSSSGGGTSVNSVPAPGSTGDSMKSRIQQDLAPEFEKYHITDPGAQQKWINDIATQGTTESGWRDIPQAIHDVNSEKGTPAQGYLQYVPSTFEHASELAGNPNADIHNIDDQIKGVLPLEESEHLVDSTGAPTGIGTPGKGWG